MTVRIAHFIDTQNKGGAEVTLMDLAMHQKSLGYEVFVIHLKNDYISSLCQQQNIKTLTIPAHRYYKRTVTLPLFALAFARMLRKNKIDVLHSHLFGPITANAMATKFSCTRHIGTLHDIYMIEDKPARAKLLLLAHKLGTQLVCVSKDMSDFYKQRLTLCDDEIITIYNASQISIPPDKSTHKKLLATYGLKTDDIIITTVGRLVTLKRIDWIINALAAIDKSVTNHVRLVIIGDGPEKTQLLRLADEKLHNKVTFTGEISNVSELLNISDIYTQFSNTEGLSRSIIEALSCQLPCIVSDVGGNREMVLDDVNGYLIEADNKTLLTTRLAKLLAEPTTRERFSSASFSHFEINFNFTQFQDAYLALYGATSE